MAGSDDGHTRDAGSSDSARPSDDTAPSSYHPPHSPGHQASASTSTLGPDHASTIAPGPEASTSTLVAHPTPKPKNEAGPLPSKRGEIGFEEGLHENAAAGRSTDNITPLPERHPADRDSPPSPATAAPTSAPTTAPQPTREARRGREGPEPLLVRLRLLGPKARTFRGVRAPTLLLLAIQLGLIAATIVGWAFAALTLAEQHRQASNQTPPDNGGGNGGGNGQGGGGGGLASSDIFIHVLFAIALLAQLLLLERRLFVFRAERFLHTHPGSALPSSFARRNGGWVDGGGGTEVGWAPWARPPLPTYAAALAQAGVGTGDVEDHLIAAPPPPAYGNTRGSTLLLAGMLRRSLTNRVSAGGGSQRSGSASVRERERGEGERPVSYKSLDSEWEVICDADRALRLEHTLAQLEEGGRR